MRGAIRRERSALAYQSWNSDIDAITADPDGPTTRDGLWALRDSGGDWAYACGHPRVPDAWKAAHCGDLYVPPGGGS